MESLGKYESWNNLLNHLDYFLKRIKAKTPAVIVANVNFSHSFLNNKIGAVVVPNTTASIIPFFVFNESSKTNFVIDDASKAETTVLITIFP